MAKEGRSIPISTTIFFFFFFFCYSDKSSRRLKILLMDLKVAAADLLLQKRTHLSSTNKNALVGGRWERNASVPPNFRS